MTLLYLEPALFLFVPLSCFYARVPFPFRVQGICTRIFQVLKCKSIEGHPVEILHADFGVECFGEEHLPKAIFACVFMVLYVIGVPIGVWVLLWAHKKHLFDPSQPKHHKVRREFGTLFEQYEPKYWYCELQLSHPTVHTRTFLLTYPGYVFL